MAHFFPGFLSTRHLRAVALSVGLLAGPTAAYCQATTVYGLGTVTTTYGAYATGTQVLAQLNPASPTLTTAGPLPLVIAGVATGQQLVGLDVRPNTGQVYALGYNSAATTSNAQLYVLAISPTAVVAAPVGGALTLALGTSVRTDLNGYGLATGIGFDFNPRVDRIRVTGPNRANYRLNPNTGALVATDATLTYATTGNAVPPPTPPLIGAVAYTNVVPGLVGTTLYDLDQTPNNGVLATQSTVSAPPITNGTLTAVAGVTLAASATATSFGIGDATFDLDVFTDPNTRINTAYLLELTGPTAGSPGSSNLYTLDLGSGRATLLGNIIGRVGLRFTNIAAAPTPGLSLWTGAVSTDWGTPGNWSTNLVPTSGVDVFIPGPGATVPRQPTVSNAQQARSVVLGAGDTGLPAVLTTADGGTLSVYGNFVNNDGSVAGSGTGTVALVGSTGQDISGANLSQFQNLRVGPAGATVSGAAAVQRALTLTGNLNIATGQPFTLLSNAAGTAFVVNSGGVATGAATVQRNIASSNADLGYRYYAAPVSNTTLSDLATPTFTPVVNEAYNTSPTPSQVTPFPTVLGYSQAQYESSPATTITSDFDKGFYSPASLNEAMPVGQGFAVNLKGTELVDFVGQLTTGNVSTPAQGRSAKATAGWQLLGNPYPSPLDWNQVASTGLSGLASAVYVFKSTSQFGGSYASYVNGQGTNGGTNVLPVAQGFFVRNAAVGTSGSINFTNAQRLTDGSDAPFQRTTADVRPQLLLELSAGSRASQADIYFESGATAGFDNAYDAYALPFLNGLTLASEVGTDLLAINGLPALTGAAVTVPLRLSTTTAGTYTLRAVTLSNLPTGYRAYLRDAVLGTYTDLTTTPSLSLNLTTAPNTGRYSVLFSTSAPLATASATVAALVAVYPSPAHGAATLLLPQALRGASAATVQVVNVLGQAVLTRTVAPSSPDSIELPLAGVAAGIYTVQATTAAGLVAKRLVVN
ncbi:DUF4394 domain-containing protein [Hymenobacter ginkgonis]|nr:DUF4394 domain-containing protein [Hymenobacter ginkgonis]